MLTDEAKLAAEIAVGLAHARGRSTSFPLSSIDFDLVTREAIKIVKECAKAFPTAPRVSIPTTSFPPKGPYELPQKECWKHGKYRVEKVTDSCWECQEEFIASQKDNP